MSQLKEYVESRLFDAGRTMLMLPPQGTSPKQYGNGWPEYMAEFSDLVGAPKEVKVGFPRATMKQMNEYEEVTDWIMKLAGYCKNKRMPYIARSLTLRILIHPVSGKHLLTWQRIGNIMNGSSPTSAKNWYEQGLDKLITLNGMQIQENIEYSEFMQQSFDAAY